MFHQLQIIKGIHPGIFLGRELSKRKLKKSAFALSVGEYPQTIGAIILGKRKMNPSLAVRIENALNIEEGFLMCLQALYEVKLEKTKTIVSAPDLTKFRKSLFWDTEIEKIDWQKSRTAILKRVYERGNSVEVNEAESYYGIKKEES